MARDDKQSIIFCINFSLYKRYGNMELNLKIYQIFVTNKFN